jgi:hypothetical protein
MLDANKIQLTPAVETASYKMIEGIAGPFPWMDLNFCYACSLLKDVSDIFAYSIFSEHHIYMPY